MPVHTSQVGAPAPPTPEVSTATHTTIPASFERKVFALIVGINRYKKQEIPPLHGCIYDSEDFRKFLLEDLSVPSNHILFLYNESATRDNILSAFDNHLVHNKKISKGDLIFFFYAGHGGRMAAPPEWKCEEDKIETICPYDETVFKLEAMPTGTSEEQSTRGGTSVAHVENDLVSCIPDHKFGDMMRRLARKKGDNIIAIFDCCHSGGMARGADFTSPTRNLLARSLPDGLWRPPLSKDDRNTYRDHFEAATARNAKMVVPSGFSYSGLKSHILLAACQPNELAHEHRPPSASSGGETARGLFTLHLLHCLRLAVKEKNILTYASLVRGLYDHELPDRQDNPGPLRKQRPHCEGANKDRLLFTTTLFPHADTFTLNYDSRNGGLYVEAGESYGIKKDAEFICQRPGKNPMHPIHLVVTNAKPFRSKLDLKDRSTDTPLEHLHGVKATIVFWSLEDASFKVHGLHNLPEKGGQFSFVTQETPSSADISCARNSTDSRAIRYDVTRNDPLIAHFGPKTLSINFKPDAGFLSHVAKFNFHLYRSNPLREVTKKLSFTMLLHRLKEVPNSVINTVLTPVNWMEDFLGDALAKKHTLIGNTETLRKLGTSEIQEAVINELEPYYGLTLINNSEYDLFPYVFHFDPEDCSIARLYLPPSGEDGSAPLKRSGKLEIGYSNGQGVLGESIQFSLKAGVRRESSFLKVFVLTSYVDMQGLEQGAYETSVGRGITMTKVPVDGGWSSSTCVLTVVDQAAPEAAELKCGCGSKSGEETKSM